MRGRGGPCGEHRGGFPAPPTLSLLDRYEARGRYTISRSVTRCSLVYFSCGIRITLDELSRVFDMRIDQDYLKTLLQACLDSKGPTFDIEDLRSAGIDYSDSKFEFHMMILYDQSFIAQDNGDPGIGLMKAGDGSPSWSVLPLRLTAAGHQFAEALSNQEVWATIKQSFKDVSIKTLTTVALRLLDGYVQKKVNQLLC